MTLSVERRRVLVAGGATLASALMPTAASAVITDAGGSVRLYDPTIPRAKKLALAGARPDTRLIPLEGDRVRLWRDSLADHQGPITGYTRWSDFVLLRGLAAEQGLRVRQELFDAGKGVVALFGWVVA